MANTIKLKNASGSDPSASDLVLGELAVRTDTGKIFLKKDNGNVAEVSGGGLSDGDKGDITVSNSGDTLTIDSGATQVANKLPLAGGTLTGGLIGTTAVFSSTSSSPALEAKGDGSSTDGYLQLNCSQNSHGIKLSSPAHSAGASYTFTFPTSISSGQFLTTDSNGNTSWAAPTDNNFTTTLKNKLDGIESGSTADQTASEILTLIKTVDGAGSGLAADTLDGVSSTQFLRSDTADTATGAITFAGSHNEKIILEGSGNSPYIRFREGTTEKAYIQWSFNGYFQIRNQEDGSGIRIKDDLRFSPDDFTNNYKIWHEGNMGAGSGLNADTVDSIQASSFLRSDATDSFSGQLTSTSSADEKIILSGSSNPYIRWQEGTTNKAYIQWNAAGYLEIRNQEDDSSIKLKDVPQFSADGSTYHNMFHAGNLTVGDGGLTQNNFTTTLKNKLDGIAASATNVTNNNQLTNGAGYITSAALAGASDGGNAALLDGIDSTQFLRADQDDSTTGILSITTNSQYPLTINGSHNGKIVLKGSTSPYIRFQESTANKAYIQWVTDGNLYIVNQETDDYLMVGGGGNGLKWHADGSQSTVWNSINDGSGSGLDADTVDGIQGANFLRADVGDNAAGNITFSAEIGIRCSHGNQTDSNDGVITSGRFASGLNIVGTQTSSGTGRQVRFWGELLDNSGNKFWGAGNDGSGSGLDADTLDGLHASQIGGFPSGTRMIFQQTSAPSGWTKDTSDTNQRALRVVSGTAGSGGSVDFTTAFASNRGSNSTNGGNTNSTNGGNTGNKSATTGGRSLSEAQLNQHRHKVDTHNEWSGDYGHHTTQSWRQVHTGGTGYLPRTSWTGSSSSHNHGGGNHNHSTPNHSHTTPNHSHTTNVAVRYLDVIIASKD